MKDVLFANRTHGELPEAYIGREGHDGCLDELFAALNEGVLQKPIVTTILKR